MILIILNFLLTTIDSALTYQAIKKGFEEKNPFVRKLSTFSYIFKPAMLSLVSIAYFGIFYTTPYLYIIDIMLFCLALIYSLALISNIRQEIKYKYK